MVRPLSLAQHTLLADLLEQGQEELFDPYFPENGSFIVRPSAGRSSVIRSYVYYQGYRPAAGSADKGQRYSRYVGLADDPAVSERIVRFRQIKAARTERQSTVDALLGAGMPRPSRSAGRIIEALARAGLHASASVLIGTAAYQTYSGVLGVRLSKSRPPLEDGETVQFIRTPAYDEEQRSDLLDMLRMVDPSFALVESIDDGFATTRFQNAYRNRVEFLSAHRLNDDQALSLIATPCSCSVRGWLLEDLHFLLAKPVQSVVLHGPGIPVTVPAPERFVVRNLIIHGQRERSTDSQAQAKRELMQAAELIEALFLVGRELSLAEAFEEACTRDLSWRTALQHSVKMLPEDHRAILEQYPTIRKAAGLGR